MEHVMAIAARPLILRGPAGVRQAEDIALDRVLDVDALSEASRDRLGPALYAIFCLSYGELSYETVRDELLFRSGSRVALYRDGLGELVGYITFRVDRVTLEGKDYAVFCTGTYFRPGTHPGNLINRLALIETLSFKLRNPFVHTNVVIECLTPVSYRRARRIFAEVWPRPEAETPAAIEALLVSVLRDRGFEVSAATPYVVRYPDPASHQDAQRVRGSDTLRGDVDVDFYLSLNPHFEQGDVLCLLAPVNFVDLLRSLALQVRGSLQRIVR